MDIQIITGADISPNIETALALFDCAKDNPMYGEICEIYREQESIIKKIIKPAAGFCFETMRLEGQTADLAKGRRVIYALSTLGEEITEYIEGLSAQDMTRGMFADCMANSALFEFDKRVLEAIKKECKSRGVGIRKAYAPPDKIPLRVQLDIAEALNAPERLGVTVNPESLMLSPMKSETHIYTLSDDPNEINAGHECGSCGNVSCPMKKINEKKEASVTVTLKKSNDDENALAFTCRRGMTVSKLLTENGIYMPLSCGGRGTCGKCRIRVIKGTLPVTGYDRLKISQSDLARGIRLACRACPDSDITIVRLWDDKEDMQIVGSVSPDTAAYPGNAGDAVECGIAVDIGTTTIAANLVDIETGKIIKRTTGINHQGSYGADVISRIQASNEQQGEKLKSIIQKDINDIADELMKDRPGTVSRIIISANTTMQHLLMGYSCDGLSAFPFKPVNIEGGEYDAAKILGNIRLDGASLLMLPGISAFVGADIVSGLYACGFWKEDERTRLLIDLGTNGEIALAVNECIYVASTAAGPAFEGDGISLGTDLIEGAFEMRNKGILDESGLMAEPYFNDGYAYKDGIIITQKDIRKLQLAKAALCAGIKILLRKAGIEPEKVGEIYIAGGFGYYLDTAKAADIGLIPEGLLHGGELSEDRVKAAGNTSLDGATLALHDTRAKERLNAIVLKSREVTLANEPEFNDLYVKEMNFCPSVNPATASSAAHFKKRK